MTAPAPVVIGGTSHPALTGELAHALGVEPLPRLLERFPDGEHRVQLQADVRGRDVFLVQSLRGSGDHLLELLLLADACRRAGAARITGVLPYLAYARQDRRETPGVPLGARVIADALGEALDAAIVVDLHSPAVEGCFSIPVEHVSAVPLLSQAARQHARNAVVVSPDLGAAKRAEHFAQPLGLPVAIVHKSRLTGRDVTASGVVGEVRGKAPVFIDDIVSTAGTIEAATRVLLDAGCAPEVTVCATHGLFVPPAVQRLQPLPLRRILVTDSVPPPTGLALPLEIVGIAPLLADAVRRLHGVG